MQIIFDLFNTVFFEPTVNILIFLLRVFEASHIPGALGLAIIALTILIRVLLWPLMSAQLKSARQMAELKPRMDELKKKHGNDKQSLALAQSQLYKEAGVNPAAGCLPVLVQFPVLIALYQSITAMFESSHGLERINNALYIPSWHLSSSPDPYFLGLSLADKPADFARIGAVVLLVPLLTAIFQFLQSKMMSPAKPVGIKKNDSKNEKEEKESMDEAMVQVQSQMMYVLPVMIGYFSYTLPIGLALYWNALTLVSIYQQYRISGWGGLEPWVRKVFK